MVGNYISGGDADQAFEYLNGNLIELPIPGGFSNANAVNDGGTIVGSYSPSANSSSTTDVYDYASAGFQSLGSVFGEQDELDNPTAINNSGVIVGVSELDSGNLAWVYMPGGGFMNLNDLIPGNSGWQLQMATGINSSGQIIGEGTFDGQNDDFLLTPAGTTTPEPASVWLLVVSMLATAVHRHRRKLNYH